MTQKAVDFMRSPLMVLDNLVRTAGYDTCHRTEEYEAEECHQDCLEREKSQFAKECREGGGLYKCCIRSDVSSSHCSDQSHLQERQTLLSRVSVLLYSVRLHQRTRNLL